MLNTDRLQAPELTAARQGAAAQLADERLAELHAALSEIPPRIPSKYFYDAAGSALFERICELPEYYPTRTELAIMSAHAHEMAVALGAGAALVEYGSGTSRKTRLLLAALDRPSVYVPVDVAADFLAGAAAELRHDFPGLAVAPVCADFTQPFPVPPAVLRARRRVVYFPGSTIGNFPDDEAAALLRQMRALAGPGGAALVGTDLRKSPDVLRAAYDDAQGVTAEFNGNVLRHLNEEFGADFRPERFRHAAPWCDREGRIEMRLVSVGRQQFHVGGRAYALADGDYLLTEYSRKYRLGEFTALARAAGWEAPRHWTDPAALFSVHLLEAGTAAS